MKTTKHMIKLAGCIGCLAFLFPTMAIAQQQTINRKDGLAVALGASINYYYGLPNENIGSFDQDRINWEINGLVGITLARNQKDKRTMLAAFGTLGFNNAQTTSKLIQDQKYTSSSTKQSHINNYYQLEGGLIIDEILRISTGVGQQNFQTQTLTSSDGVQTQKNHLTYQVTTIGFQLDLGKVWWTIDCHIAYQKDFTNTIIIPKTGLLFQF